MTKAVYLAQDTDLNRDGDEVDVFHVYVGDEDAEALGTVYTCATRTAAFNLGEKIAADRNLELVIE